MSTFTVNSASLGGHEGWGGKGGYILKIHLRNWGPPLAYNGVSRVVLMVKNLPANARDTRDEGSIPGLGRSPGVEGGNPLQYSFLKIPRTEEPGGLQIMRLQRVRQD